MPSFDRGIGLLRYFKDGNVEDSVYTYWEALYGWAPDGYTLPGINGKNCRGFTPILLIQGDHFQEE